MKGATGMRLSRAAVQDSWQLTVLAPSPTTETNRWLLNIHRPKHGAGKAKFPFPSAPLRALHCTTCNPADNEQAWGGVALVLGWLAGWFGSLCKKGVRIETTEHERAWR